uniref:T cell leukemia homeobox 3 n=1 Tax=Laticauda laticaudata TaxID=8630 RepID=A0A8C5WR86_LATLA
MDQPTNTQTPHQHEPISFGIDQILNSSDQETPSQPAPRGSDGGTNYLGSPVSSRSGGPYPSLPGAFAGIGAPFEDSGSYSVNLSLAPSGVIRVPAHRPIPGAVPPPISSAIPAMPAVPSLGSLNFPWMESSRRFVKDRFTGKWRRRRPGWRALSGRQSVGEVGTPARRSRRARERNWLFHGLSPTEKGENGCVKTGKQYKARDATKIGRPAILPAFLIFPFPWPTA